MIKSDLTSALFAVSLLLATACGKETEPKKAVLPEPATKEVAVSLRFDKGEKLKVTATDRAKPNDPKSAIAGATVDLDIEGIDLTESSRYVLYICGVETKAVPATVTNVWLGRYAYQNGKYILEGFGTITLQENGTILFEPDTSVTLPSGEGSGVFPASVTPIPPSSGDLASNLVRNWKVSTTYVKVQAGQDGLSISKSFDGCDLKVIAAYFQEKGAPLKEADIEALSGYRILEINFIGNQQMVLSFDGPESYYGAWNLSGDTFSWRLDDSNRFLAANATGSVSFPENGAPVITINVQITTSGETYTGIIEFTLTESV